MRRANSAGWNDMQHSSQISAECCLCKKKKKKNLSSAKKMESCTELFYAKQATTVGCVCDYCLQVLQSQYYVFVKYLWKMYQ